MNMQKLRLALAVILVVLVGVLIIQNTDPVVTSVFMWSPEMPHFLVILLAFVGGGLAGYLVGRGKLSVSPTSADEDGDAPAP